MIRSKIRVCIRLERDADKTAVLEALERELGRPAELRWRFQDLPLLAVQVLPGELERIRQIPGVLSAEPEGQVPLPARPGPPTAKE